MLSNCAFRAQLALPGQRMLFDYWQDIAGDRAMPVRADFDPLKFPHLLPDLGLIDLREGFDRGHFRLAGTRLRDVYGREITGLRLTEVFSGTRAAQWRTVHSRIATEAVCAQGLLQAPAAERDHVVVQWLRLPLSDDGTRVDRILCHDIRHDSLQHSPERFSGAKAASEFTVYCAGRKTRATARA
jgi:hypothetical protein